MLQIKWGDNYKLWKNYERTIPNKQLQEGTCVYFGFHQTHGFFIEAYDDSKIFEL